VKRKILKWRCNSIENLWDEVVIGERELTRSAIFQGVLEYERTLLYSFLLDNVIEPPSSFDPGTCITYFWGSPMRLDLIAIVSGLWNPINSLFVWIYRVIFRFMGKIILCLTSCYNHDTAVHLAVVASFMTKCTGPSRRSRSIKGLMTFYCRGVVHLVRCSAFQIDPGQSFCAELWIPDSPDKKLLLLLRNNITFPALDPLSWPAEQKVNIEPV
jgi:hypothetical protein